MFDWVLNRFAALLIAVLCFCSTSLARNVRIKIVHTSDLRGQLLSLKSYGKFQGGGLLRCATVITSELAKSSNVLLLDSGNALRGTPETDILPKSIMVQAMNRLGYDAYVPARNDFDHGLNHLRQELAGFKPALIASNISNLGLHSPLPLLKDFRIFNLDGVKVAIVGLANPSTPLRVRPDYLQGLEWQSSCEALANIMPALKSARADICILLAHQALVKYRDPDNEIKTIIKRFPEFDIIIGGNTSQTVPSLLLEGVLYAQSGSRGRNVGIVDIEYDTANNSIASKSSKIIRVEKSIPQHDGLKKHLRKEIYLANTRLNETVGYAERNFKYAPLEDELPIASLVMHAVKDAVNADIVLLSLQTKQGVWAREQKERDLWRIVPYEESIGVASLTLNEIEEILLQNSKYEGQMCFLNSLGLKYDLSDGSIENLALANGSVPHPRKKLRIAFGSFVLASGGGRFNIVRDIVNRPRSRLEMCEISIRDALREYIKRHSPLIDL